MIGRRRGGFNSERQDLVSLIWFRYNQMPVYKYSYLIEQTTRLQRDAL